MKFFWMCNNLCIKCPIRKKSKILYAYVCVAFFLCPVSQLPNTVQVALGGLQRQLEEAIQRQTAAIEEKIRSFTAEQYQLLEQFRERAHNEHRLLSKYDSHCQIKYTAVNM